MTLVHKFLRSLPLLCALVLMGSVTPGPLRAQSGQGATPPSEAERPNFSGRWRMLKDKSDFGRAKMPDIIVRVVDQRGNTLNLHTVETVGTKTTSADVSYNLDGTESSNVINGHNAVSRSFWDGPALLIRTTIKMNNGQEEMVLDRWELSADGQILTNFSTVTTEKGGIELKLVCMKEKTEGSTQ